LHAPGPPSYQTRFSLIDVWLSTTYSPTCCSCLNFAESKVPEMGDFQGPFVVSPPPSPSSSDKSSTTMLYYGLVVVGVAATALALYNCIIIRRSRRHDMQSEGEGANGLVEVVMESRIENCERNFNLVSSFKYKNEGVVGYDDECSVCLSGFEEGEEVRKLPECKHWFHAPCIDMWLYSHLDCPICRTPVLRFSQALLESGSGVLEWAIMSLWMDFVELIQNEMQIRGRWFVGYGTALELWPLSPSQLSPQGTDTNTQLKHPTLDTLFLMLRHKKRFSTPHFFFFFFSYILQTNA